jgi:hypothetical protein
MRVSEGVDLNPVRITFHPKLAGRTNGDGRPIRGVLEVPKDSPEGAGQVNFTDGADGLPAQQVPDPPHSGALVNPIEGKTRRALPPLEVALTFLSKP